MIDPLGDPVPWTSESLEAAFDSIGRNVDQRTIENWRSARFMPSRRNRINLARIASRGAPHRRQIWTDQFLSLQKTVSDFPVPTAEAAPVTPREPSQTSDESAVPFAKSGFWMLGLLATLLLSAIILWSVNLQNDARPYTPSVDDLNNMPQTRIAVLGFSANSDRPSDAALAAGLHDMINHALVQIDQYDVVPARTVRAIQSRDGTLRDVATALDTQYLVVGEVVTVEDRPRLLVRLVSHNDAGQSHIWSDSFGERTESLLSAHLEIANDISEVLKIEVSPDSAARMRSAGTTNIKAYLDYLRARHRLKFWHEHPKDEDIWRSARDFLSATQHDPAWSAPRFHIADIFYHAAAGHIQTPNRIADDMRTLVPRDRREALAKLRETLQQSAMLANTPMADVQARLNLIYFSDDWAGLKPTGRDYVEQAVSERGELEWLFEPVAILHMADVALMDRLVEDRILAFDPNNGTAHAYSVRVRLIRGQLDGAQSRLDQATARTFSNRLDEVQAYLHVARNDWSALSDHIETAQYLSPVLRDYFMAIVLAQTSGQAEALAQIAESSALQDDAVQRAFAFHHVGASEEADQLFSDILADPGGLSLVQTALVYGAGCGASDIPSLEPVLLIRAKAGLPPLSCIGSKSDL